MENRGAMKAPLEPGFGCGLSVYYTVTSSIGEPIRQRSPAHSPSSSASAFTRPDLIAFTSAA
jgi:hypothetical protein